MINLSLIYDSLSYFVSFFLVYRYTILALRTLSNRKVEQTLWIVGPKADQYLSIRSIAKLS